MVQAAGSSALSRWRKEEEGEDEEEEEEDMEGKEGTRCSS